MKFRALALLFAGLLSDPVHAAPKEEQGVEVKVTVVDVNGKPIPTSVVRHPDESDRHRVNSEDGSWKATALYMPDGSELRFTPGMDLSLEVSAPGYKTQQVVYQVRKSRNALQVSLEEIQTTEENVEEPIITFKQDKAREATE
ncbi:MAG TPA: hypothetical protein PKY30_21625 [Myxococcota bacterium]|nr:hypothetical protein [Myxococcota bacterium]HND32568.1 hypothetical protein [Myxococcota bacterium]HNH49659.1 hypothetical protein [Myxococcota bacterium]